MTPTQEHLFKLLLEIDDICKRHGVEYWLEYGTALGAVRHEGFIPWDNDLDISMTEVNYDKFKAACEKELDGKTRMFCDQRTDRDVPHVFGHYVDLTCCRMTQRTAYWKNCCGQTIDVFCHVAMPKDRDENKRISNLFYAYDEYCNRCFPHYQRKTPDIYELYLDMQRREREIGREAVLQEAEEQIFGHYHQDSEMWMCASARMNWSVFWPHDFYENLKEVTFEGRTFHVVSDWYEFFAAYYGDDFMMYPSSLRIHTEMSHSNVPSQAYADDFTRMIDVDTMLEHRGAYKDLAMENGYRKNIMVPAFYRAVGAVVRRHIEQRVEREGIDIAALLERGDWESVRVLRSLLGEYLEKQMHPSMFYWRTHLGCSDIVDCAGMYVLLVDQMNVYAIDKLVQVRVFNGMDIPEKMREICEAAHHVRDMKKHLHYGEMSESRRHIDWALANLPEMEGVLEWDLLHRSLTATGTAELEACLARAEELRARFKRNDLCKKVWADIAARLGRTDEAEAVYDELARTTRDGFILLDIEKKRSAKAAGEASRREIR